MGSKLGCHRKQKADRDSGSTEEPYSRSSTGCNRKYPPPTEEVSNEEKIHTLEIGYTEETNSLSPAAMAATKPKPMDTDQSPSDSWRKEGNQHYVSATTNLAPVLRMQRFQKALTCYESAHSSAKTDTELSSAAKNVAMTSWKMAKLCAETDQRWPLVKHHFGHALKYFNNAYTRGESGNQTQTWRDNILASSRGCWEDMSVISTEMMGGNEHGKVSTIREFIDYIPGADMKADCFMDIADYHFHRGLAQMSAGLYKGCLGHMKDCYYPMNEAMRYGGHLESLQDWYQTMEGDVHMQSSLAEAMKSRQTADELFDEVVMEEESLNVDMIWEVIDWYKDSIIKVRDLDVKQEAISLCRLGLVYDKVLKIQFKAKEYLKKSLELAQAIQPFNVSNETWYRDCVAVLEKYQKETVQHEQEEEQKRKAAVKEELKKELDDLKKHESDDYADYLKYLYKTYPPINKDHQLNLTKNVGDDDFIVKYKALQKAIIHYHPDRVNEEEHGLKAKVLNEEITKYLTNRYERVKSMK